jgi:hypothetical protein
MAWWPKRKRGRHTAEPTGHPITVAMEKAASDLRESIMERPDIDRLAALVRREFGVR